jgi:hypothetical protein
MSRRPDEHEPVTSGDGAYAIREVLHAIQQAREVLFRAARELDFRARCSRILSCARGACRT